MPKLEFKHPHTLPLDEAKVKVKDLVEEIQAQYPNLVSTVTWAADGQEATASGKLFDGHFQLTSNAVLVKVELSFLASPFKGKVEDKIRTRLRENFG